MAQLKSEKKLLEEYNNNRPYKYATLKGFYDNPDSGIKR